MGLFAVHPQLNLNVVYVHIVIVIIRSKVLSVVAVLLQLVGLLGGFYSGD